MEGLPVADNHTPMNNLILWKAITAIGRGETAFDLNMKIVLNVIPN